MARTLKELTLVEERTHENGKTSCMYSVIKRGNLFYLLFNISSNFKIESYFKSETLESLRDEFTKKIVLDDDESRTIVFNMAESETYTFSENLEQELWFCVRYSYLSMESCFDDLIAGKDLVVNATTDD
jgi:hypothetical protein